MKIRILPAFRLGILTLAVFVAGTGTAWAFGSRDEKSQDSAPAEKIVYREDFEKGDGGWRARGKEVVAVSSGNGREGGSALKISGRQATWNGPIRDMSVTLKPGQTYRISFWAMFPEGPESQAVNTSIQRVVDGAGEEYTTVGADRFAKGEWTKFELVYSVPKSKFETPLSLYFETPYKSGEASPDDLIDFFLDDIEITKLPPAPPPEAEKDIPSFASLFPELTVGAAINRSYFDPANAHHELLRHFNAFVYGNEMKMDAMQPVEGKFNFNNADYLVDWAAKNGKLVRGHTLLWHSQYPKWFFKSSSSATDPATKEELLARIKNHIQTIATRYRGKIDTWDVVNEVVGEDGNLRDSEYLKIVGSDEYIAQAFRWAHEADPEAKLTINDYNIEYSGAKQEGFYNLVKKLLDEGVPISVVGLQSHISIARPSVNDLRSAIRRFASLGVKVQVTELDLSIYADGNEPRKMADRETLLEQAYKYRDLFAMFREEAKAGNLDMVMLWGISDDDTWLDNFPVAGRTDHPLLFGKDLRAKSAYWAMVDPERLPIYIQKVDAPRPKSGAVSADSDIWKFVSPRPIADRKGASYGSFKAAWTTDSLHALVTIEDATADASDGVTFFLEPKNARGETRSDAAVSMTVTRGEAIADDGSSYTLFATVPFGGTGAKLDTKVGFDLRVADGTAKRSWNDFTDSQETSSVNLGVLNLKDLPPVTFAKRGTAKIDGRAEGAWDAAEAVPLDVKTQGFTLDGSTFKAMWDDETLYVLFEVKDELLNDKAADAWEQDSVEVFIDQNNAKTKTYEPDDAQYRVSFRNAVSFNGGDEGAFASKSRIFPGGYMVEIAVPLTSVKAAPGVLLGFDAQVNEADASGVRSGIRNWVNATNMGYQDTSGFGVLMLEE